MKRSAGSTCLIERCVLGSLLAFHSQFAWPVPCILCAQGFLSSPPLLWASRQGERAGSTFPETWSAPISCSLPSSLSISSRSLGRRGGSLAVYEGLGWPLYSAHSILPCIRHTDTFTRVKGGSKGCGKSIFLVVELGPPNI